MTELVIAETVIIKSFNLTVLDNVIIMPTGASFELKPFISVNQYVKRLCDRWKLGEVEGLLGTVTVELIVLVHLDALVELIDWIDQPNIRSEHNDKNGLIEILRN